MCLFLSADISINDACKHGQIIRKDRYINNQPHNFTCICATATLLHSQQIVKNAVVNNEILEDLKERDARIKAGKVLWIKNECEKYKSHIAKARWHVKK